MLLEWPWLPLSVLGAYLAAILVVVSIGTVACAVFTAREPMDAEQERVFAQVSVAPALRLLALLEETLWQALALVLQVLHTFRLLRAPTGPTSGRPVVLLPGYFENPGTLWVLARRLARAGFSPVLLDYPSHASTIPRNAAWLGEQIARIRASRGGERVLVVAHSMSGLVVRTLLLSERDHGVCALCALSSPFRGTHLARITRVLGLHDSVRDMAPGSAFMQAFRHDRVCDVPILSQIGTQEDVVTPEWSAVIAGADNRVFSRPYGHVAPLFARGAFEVILRWLRAQNAPA